MPIPPGSVSNKKFWLFIILGFTVVVYLPVFNNGFTNWDDTLFVTENSLITSFSANHIITWFTQPFAGQYQPLILMSFAIDYAIDGLNPLVFHTTNLILHLVNIILLFRLLELLFKNSFIALFTSLLFAVHTLNVETVAWVTERKNLLYVLFFLGSLICYTRYLQSRKSSFYILSLGLFIISLLSKGAAVVLPLLLLVIDNMKDRRIFTWDSLRDKMPFFLLALISGIMTLIAHYHYGALVNSTGYPFWLRLVFTGKAMAFYLAKSIVPLHLSAYYPLPENLREHVGILIFEFILIYLFLFIAIATAFYKRWKIIFFGLTFFFINLFLFLVPPGVPVAATDRYMYLSSVGIFIIIVAAINRIRNSISLFKLPGLVILVVYIAFLGNHTYQRTKIWHDSLSLWNNVIENTGKTYFPLLKRGISYRNENKFPEALTDFNASIRLNPKYYTTYDHRGYLFLLQDEPEKAIPDFNKSVRLKPDNSFAYNSLGFALNKLGRYDEALKKLDTAIQLDPEYGDAYKNRGRTFIGLDKATEACADLRKSLNLNIDPESKNEVISLLDQYCKDEQEIK